ncbi:hypothetical protein D3C81_2048690 [compost metagenome]
MVTMRITTITRSVLDKKGISMLVSSSPNLFITLSSSEEEAADKLKIPQPIRTIDQLRKILSTQTSKLQLEEAK